MPRRLFTLGVLERWSPWAWSCAILTGLLGLAYAPLLGGRLLYNRDLSRFIYPIRWFVRDSFERGERPWWTPHIGLGHSMLADPQSALFYPVNLLHLVGPLPSMVMLVMFLHLLWGALGMARVARAFHAGSAAGLVAGLAWALSGYVTSLWTNGARLPSAAWMPWQILLFIAVARAVRDRRGPWLAVAGLGVVNGMGFLAGDFFVALMGHLVGLGLALVWLGSESPGSESPMLPVPVRLCRGLRRSMVSLVVLSALGVGLGVSLSGVAILPASRALAETERMGGLPAGPAEAASFHPARAAEFVAPEAFTRAWYLDPNQGWVGRYLGATPISLNVYLGGSVVALLFLAFVPLRKRRPERGPSDVSPNDVAPGEDRGVCGPEPSLRAAAMVGVVGLLFLFIAFGRHLPVHQILRTLVPPFRYMRSPEKHLLSVIPCVALLAGLGAHKLLHPSSRPAWNWGLCVPALLLALGLAAPMLFPAGLAEHVRASAWHGLLAAALVAMTLVLVSRHALGASAFLLLLLVGDLALASKLTLRFADSTALRRPELAQLLRPDQSVQSSLALPALPFPRLFRGSKVDLAASRSSTLAGDEITRETLRDNLSVPFGVAILPGYGVAIPSALTDLLDQGRMDALRLLATDYALLSAPKTQTAAANATEPLSPGLTSMPGLRLHKLERALPRAFVSFRVAKHPAHEIARHLLDPEVVAGATVLLDDSATWTGASAVDEGPVPCQLVRMGTTFVHATCRAPVAGLVVFVEQFATGWTARVDGAPAPLLRANQMMRAVPMPAGTHDIVLAFKPPGLALGFLFTLLGLGATLALVVVGARGHRNQPSSTRIFPTG